MAGFSHYSTPARVEGKVRGEGKQGMAGKSFVANGVHP